MTSTEVAVVDTDVLSFLLLGKAPERAAEFEEMLSPFRLLAISFATYGEMLALGYGARWGQSRPDDLRQALRQYVVLPYSRRVAETWAALHAKLSGSPHRGGANDLWTAACALSRPEPLPISTNNLSDLDQIRVQRPELTLLHPERTS